MAGEDGMESSVATGKHWFALYTKPHKEYLVRDLLRGQGIEVYLPEIRVAVRRRGRRQNKPFFPHYLFARFEAPDGLTSKVRWTPGLRWIVSAGGRPVPVPDEVMAHLRQRLAVMTEVEPQGPFQKGDAVHIRGPFEGLEAVFDQRLSPAGRVRVFLRLMSRWVATELDLGDLLPSR
jgi:transcriptional antiterminator RfaH